MRCLPDVMLPTDSPFWINRDAFLKHFDQVDFNCRECKDVAPFYLAEWFYTPENGSARFILPTVMFINGKTEFISGRHRTAVLLPFLAEFPIAFGMINKPPDDFLRKLAPRVLTLNEMIELPDLPIVEHIP
jgi:hypothetical protein